MVNRVRLCKAREQYQMKRWDRLVERYLEEYEALGRASETVKGLRRELDRWGNWLKGERPQPKLEEVNSDVVIRYLRGRGAYRKKATLYGAISRLRGMGQFLMREGVWLSNPLRWIHGPKLDVRSRLPKRISRESMQRLWEEAAVNRYGYHRSLWVALLAVFYGTGSRRGEVSRLDVSDWSREEGTLVVRSTKTSVERRVPVPALIWQCLEAYLPKRQNHLEALGRGDEKALFVCKYGGRLTGSAISRGIQRLSRRFLEAPITMHQFRHSCASDLLEEGVRLPEVQRLLGHATISTTMRYLHVADPQLHAAVKAHPINAILGEGGAA
jgi:integrase/recombinase XerC